MNVKARSVTLLVTILTITLLMVGCIGGGSTGVSNERQIRDFLKEVEVAFKSLDAEKLANLWHYPIVIEGEEVSKKDMEAAFHLAFREAKLDGLVIHEFRIMVSDSDILVDSSGERAAIENVKFYMSGALDGEELPAETVDGPPFELAKKSGKWKLSGFVAFLDM